MSGWAQREAERQEDEADEAVELSGVAKALAAAEVEARKREAPVRRRRFEYRVVEVDDSRTRWSSAGAWTETLTYYTSEGWRVVSTIALPGFPVRAVLERPVANGGAA